MEQNVLPKDTSTVRIIRDIFLVDFYEKFTSATEFVKLEQLQKWVDFYQRKPIEGISYIVSGNKQNLKRSDMFCTEMAYFCTKQHPTITEILDIGDGKISICGCWLSHLFMRDTVPYIEFYFDSVTQSESVDLLLRCLKILGENVIYYIVDNKLCYMRGYEHFGSFNLTIYENKASLLRNIGPSPDRHGWNFKDGYFGSISAGVSLAMGIYAFDIDFKDKHLCRYDSLGLNILFHGITRPLEHGDVINFIGGHIKCEGGASAIVSLNNKDCDQINLTYSEVVSSLPSMLLFKDKYVKATKPNDWYLETYIPYVVGISDDRYVALSNIRKKFNLDEYVFRILCNAWLAAEVSDAKQRLFDMVN